jgi:hypothetical protein
MHVVRITERDHVGGRGLEHPLALDAQHLPSPERPAGWLAALIATGFIVGRIEAARKVRARTD